MTIVIDEEVSASGTIADWASLIEAVAGFMHVDDNDTASDITDNIPIAIQLLEAELNDELILKNMESEETLTLTVGQNYVALPSGFVSPIAMWLVVDGERVELRPELPQNLPYNTDNTQPVLYAIDGSNVRFDSPSDDTYTAYLRCVKASNLSATNTTNYLLLKRPDIYLYGTLKHCAVLADDDRNQVKWERLYELAKARLKEADSRNRSRVPLRNDFGGGYTRPNIYRGE